MKESMVGIKRRFLFVVTKTPRKNQTFTVPSKKTKEEAAGLTLMLQDDFALVLLEDVDENLYLTETLPSAGTPVRLPQMMGMVSEMVGGTEKIQWGMCFKKWSWLEGNGQVVFSTHFWVYLFGKLFWCVCEKNKYMPSRKLTVSPLQGASGRSFSDSGGIWYVCSQQGIRAGSSQLVGGSSPK